MSPGQVLLRQQTEKETNLRSTAPSQSQSPRAKSAKSRQYSAASRKSRTTNTRMSRRTDHEENADKSRASSVSVSRSSAELNARRKSSKPIIRNNIGGKKLPIKKKALFTQVEAKPKPPVMPPVLKQWLDFKPNMDPKNPIAEISEHEKGFYLKGRKNNTIEIGMSHLMPF